MEEKKHNFFGVRFDTLGDSDKAFEHIDYGSEYDYYIYRHPIVLCGNIRCHLLMETDPNGKGMTYLLRLVPAPSSLRPKMRERVAECCCVGTDELEIMDVRDYGYAIDLECETVETDEPLQDRTPDRECLDKAATAVETISGLIGFYLDRQLNRIGNTGWDFLKKFVYGTDIIKKALGA